MHRLKKFLALVLVFTLVLPYCSGFDLLINAFAVDDIVAATNENLTYYGRWTENADGSMTSGWGTSKIRFKLEDTDTFTVNTSAESYTDLRLFVSTDDTTFVQAAPTTEGVFTFNLQGERPETGWEVLLFTQNSTSGKAIITIKSITPGEGGTISKTGISKPVVEIVGDSISDDWLTDTNNDKIASSSAYIAKAMGWEAVNIAAAGITLTDRTNNSLASPNGMETMYFRANNTGTDTTAWAFPAEQEPDYIMLHIGTNDRYLGVSGDSFQQAYVNFLRNIRLKNPNATILCLSPYGGKFGNENTFDYAMDDEIKAAVNEIHTQYYDYNVFYIESTGLITAENFSEYFDDYLHPAESSFKNISDYVTPLLTEAVQKAHSNTSNSYSNYVMSQKGFKASELKTYEEWLQKLDAVENEGAYSRLSKAIAKLKSGYSYYDDFLVFGDYVSDMDDTKLAAGDYFAATTNTTNYNYMFGGAHAAHFGATATAADVSELFMPSFHYATLGGSSGDYFQYTDVMDSSVNNINCALVQAAMNAVTANGYKTGTGASHHLFNKMALNTEALNYYGGLDSFQVTVNPLARPVIFYNWVDNENWSAISITTNSGNNAERVGYSYVNCVNGILDTNSIYCWKNQTTNNILWDITADTTNATAISTTGYLDSDPMTLTFTWDATNKCYKLTIVDDNTNITLLDNVALTSTVSTVQKMPNLILSDINNDNSSNHGYLNSNIGIMSVSVEFEPHDCTPSDKPVADIDGKHHTVCSLCGNKIADSEVTCTYNAYAHNETHHWAVCACGNTDPDGAKTAHDPADGKCTTCGYNPNALTPEQAALAVAESIGFLGRKLNDYNEWLTTLAAYQDDTNAINGTTTVTWKEAHTRLKNAIDKLSGGVSYYDDFNVFGQFKSDMDDTNLTADDYFAADINTTNYNYMFGGAYAQRLETESEHYGATLNNTTTSPTAADVTKLFMPSFHFGAMSGYKYSGLADTSGQPGSNILVQPANSGASGSGHHFINKLALNTQKLGFVSGLDSFTVQVDPTAWPVIFYNYKDANNWSAVSIAGSSGNECNPMGYATINCVNGVLDTVSMLVWENSNFSGTTGRLWNMETDTTNAALISSNSYLDSDPMTLTFTWDATNKCYELTIVDDNTNTTLLDNVALTSSLTMDKMPNLILSDIRNNNGSNDEYLSSKIGILAVSATFEEHICQGEWISDGTNHYQKCAECGETIEGTADTCNRSGYAHDGTHHWAACSFCGYQDEGAEKTLHSYTHNLCECGFELNAESAAVLAVTQQGFLGSKVNDYTAWLSLFEGKKEDETAINAETTATWKQAYDRLSKAISKLNGNVTYFDDFAVFGQFKSDMSDTDLAADDYFKAEINTTNYNYMFGGAYFSILSADAATTAADVTELFMPSFHFGTVKSNYYNYTTDMDSYVTNINCALVQRWKNPTGVDYPTDGWANHQFFNKMDLNVAKVLGSNDEIGLDSFTVTIDPTAHPVIFYNYVDANNWSAITVSIKGSGNNIYRSGYSNVNCKDGLLDTNTIYCWEDSGYTGTKGQLWNVADEENAETLSKISATSYLDSDPMTLTFTWDATNQCYKLTIVDDNTNTVLLSEQALNTSTVALHKMSTLILSDVNNDNRTNNGYKNSNIGILAVSMTAGEAEHVCKAQGDWIHDSSNDTHYKACSCGKIVESTRQACSGAAEAIPGTTTHRNRCDTCGELYGTASNCTWGAYVTENGQHHQECTSCSNKTAAEACQAGEYSYNENGHWQLCVTCGEKLASTEQEHTHSLATYLKEGQCVCGHKDGQKLTVDFNPVILGGKILKTSENGTQKLRIDVDFTDTYKLVEKDGAGTIEEYGVIIAVLDDVLTEDKTDAADTVDLQKLKNLYDSNKVAVTGDLPDPGPCDGANEDRRLVKIIVSVAEANYGKRFVMIAYVKTADGNFYYSENDKGGPNQSADIAGLTDGYISTGIMRVMKAIMADKTDSGYYNKIADAAAACITTGYLPDTLKEIYTDATELAELIQDYATGAIGTGHENYQDAKAIMPYVYYVCAGFQEVTG